MDLARATGEPPRGETGERVFLDEHRGQAGALRAPHNWTGGVAPGADYEDRSLRLEQPAHGTPHATRDQRPAQVPPPRAPVDRLHGEQVEAERVARQHLRLDAARGADEHRLHVGARLDERLRECQGRHEMTAGAAAGEEDTHAHGAAAIGISP